MERLCETGRKPEREDDGEHERDDECGDNALTGAVESCLYSRERGCGADDSVQVSYFIVNGNGNVHHILLQGRAVSYRFAKPVLLQGSLDFLPAEMVVEAVCRVGRIGEDVAVGVDDRDAQICVSTDMVNDILQLFRGVIKASGEGVLDNARIGDKPVLRSLHACGVKIMDEPPSEERQCGDGKKNKSGHLPPGNPGLKHIRFLLRLILA